MYKFLLIFLFSFSAMADTDWARVAMNTAVVLDWAQTRDIRNHADLQESNKLLGPNPTDAEINRFFILILASYNLVGEYLISEKYQAYFYAGIGMAHADSVMHNHSVGVTFKFD